MYTFSTLKWPITPYLKDSGLMLFPNFPFSTCFGVFGGVIQFQKVPKFKKVPSRVGGGGSAPLGNFSQLSPLLTFEGSPKTICLNLIGTVLFSDQFFNQIVFGTKFIFRPIFFLHTIFFKIKNLDEII